MSKFARILPVVTGLLGLCTLTLGLLIWIANMDLREIHMLFGLSVTLLFLSSGIMSVATRGLRLLGVVSIIYALIIPVLGLSQFTLLPGSLHWIIQVIHMLVGLGALVLTGLNCMYYLRQRQPAPTDAHVATDSAVGGVR